MGLWKTISCSPRASSVSRLSQRFGNVVPGSCRSRRHIHTCRRRSSIRRRRALIVASRRRSQRRPVASVTSLRVSWRRHYRTVALSSDGVCRSRVRQRFSVWRRSRGHAGKINWTRRSMSGCSGVLSYKSRVHSWILSYHSWIRDGRKSRVTHTGIWESRVAHPRVRKRPLGNSFGQRSAVSQSMH